MKNWEKKKLADVCDFKSGTTISPSLEREVGDVLYVKVGDMNLPENEIEINTSSRFVNSYEIKQAQIIPEGAVIFPKRGGAISTNKKRKVVKPTIVDLNTMAITPTNKLDSEYFYYWFQMIDLNDISNGTTIPQINNYSFDEIFIQYPKSLPEQQRIVSILDEVFSAIERSRNNAQQNLKNAKELFESYLQGVFEKKGDGWINVTLEELLQKGWIISHLDGNHGGDYPRKEEFINEGVPYISANCLKGTNIDFSLAKYLSNEKAETFRKGVAINNDVLFAHNATVGPVAILKTSERKIILGTSLTYYRCNPEFILPEYLANYMRSKEFKQQYELVMRQSTRNQVPITKQREFYHIIPPIEFQKSIVQNLQRLLEQSQKLEAVYQKKIEDLEELKKSILQKVFAGELRSGEPAEPKTEKAVAV